MNLLSNIPKQWIVPLVITVVVYGILVALRAILRYRKREVEYLPPEPPGAWPLIGHLPIFGGSVPIARTLGALADNLGPVFALRLGGNRRAVVVSSWEAIRDCFVANDAVFVARPDMAIGRRVGYNNTAFALAPHGPFWRDTRRMATEELFSNASLDALRGVKLEVVNSYLKEVHERCRGDGESAMEMDGWFERLMISMNIRVVAGRRFSPASFGAAGGEAERLRKVVKEVLGLSGVFVASDAVPWLEWADFGGFLGRMDTVFEEFDALLQKFLEDKKGGNETEMDFNFMGVMLSHLAEIKDAPRPRDTIIKATAMTLILTGTESTSLTLIWALSHLLNHPHELRNAQDEIDKAIGRNRWVEETDIKNLPYLQAIIKESLRLHPPGPLSGPREAMHDCYVAGYRVPKGTRLIVNLWKLHRDPRVWDNPNDFLPQRFLDKHADFNFRGQCYEYAPFSAGRRSCPAVTYAVQVTHLVLARLLQGFDVAARGGGPVDMREGLGIALPKVTPLEAVLSPRLPPELYELL